LLWTAQGAYSAKDGRVQEGIVLNGHPPYRGEIRTMMTCDGDPWLGNPTCINMKTAAQGEVSTVTPLLSAMQSEVMNRKHPLLAGFPYDRNLLLAQREADLKALADKAEAEARARAEAQQRKLRQKALQPKVLMVVPTIQSPTAGALFFSMTTVPIRLLPPQGIAVTSYLVKIERKDAKGNWGLVTNLPISQAEATSPAGYVGWGTGGKDGRSLSMMASPGTHRLSAQVSAPRPTGWSLPVEFVVTSPSKAIQKTPKAFGR
jgi:hypothetical protein